MTALWLVLWLEALSFGVIGFAAWVAMGGSGPHNDDHWDW